MKLSVLDNWFVYTNIAFNSVDQIYLTRSKSQKTTNDINSAIVNSVSTLRHLHFQHMSQEGER